MEEIKRVELAIAEVTRGMNDAEHDLAATVRLSVCLGELQAYLQGIRYTLGESRSSHPKGQVSLTTVAEPEVK